MAGTSCYHRWCTCQVTTAKEKNGLFNTLFSQGYAHSMHLGSVMLKLNSRCVFLPFCVLPHSLFAHVRRNCNIQSCTVDIRNARLMRKELSPQLIQFSPDAMSIRALCLFSHFSPNKCLHEWKHYWSTELLHLLVQSVWPCFQPEKLSLMPKFISLFRISCILYLHSRSKPHMQRDANIISREQYL